MKNTVHHRSERPRAFSRLLGSLLLLGSLSLSACGYNEVVERDEDVKAALTRYEHRVRPPLIQMRRAGRRGADWLVPSTSTGLAARNALLRLATRPGFSRLLRPAIEAARENVLS